MFVTPLKKKKKTNHDSSEESSDFSQDSDQEVPRTAEGDKMVFLPHVIKKEEVEKNSDDECCNVYDLSPTPIYNDEPTNTFPVVEPKKKCYFSIPYSYETHPKYKVRCTWSELQRNLFGHFYVTPILIDESQPRYPRYDIDSLTKKDLPQKRTMEEVEKRIEEESWDSLDRTMEFDYRNDVLKQWVTEDIVHRMKRTGEL